MVVETPEHAEMRHRLHWETALDRLELDVILSERLLEDPSRPLPEPWDEPRLTGPIPLDLRERAAQIGERQRAVQVRLAAQTAALGREQAFADRVDQATGRPEVSIYLDLRA
jgi:hypothetical protein